MKRLLLSLLLFYLPYAALSDGMVVPTIAYPAQVTIPDQRAIIGFSNGVERLVIETRFTGAGTNFAWVVPLPSPPVIEEATAGVFPTLQYLFRPHIIHDVTRYYLPILLALVTGLFLWWTRRWLVVVLVAEIYLVYLAILFLPLGGRTKAMSTGSAVFQDVAVLDRKLVGVFETTTIASRDPHALEAWLRTNDFLLSTNAGPVIADYVKDGWVFVASKIRRDAADRDSSTPHPLSFTFRTSRPVYPMRLTGLGGQPLSVDLYVLGNGGASARHFKVESCTRSQLAHPLLHSWFGENPIVTKLTATLSPAQMRQDVWVNLSPVFVPKESRRYSREGAVTTAANWGAGLFAVGLVVVLCRPVARRNNVKRLRRAVMVAGASLLFSASIYFSLPTIDVKLVRRHIWVEAKEQQYAVMLALEDADWHTTAEARAALQMFLADSTNASLYYLKNFNNPFTDGRLHEEDSPGNYLLRETNNQLQVIFYGADGSETVMDCKARQP